MSKLIEANEATFKSEVLESAVPVLVDFFTVYCGPCKQLKPALEELAGELNGEAKVVAVDVTVNEELATDLRISVVPTLIVFKDGREIQRLVGVQSKAKLREALGL